MSVYDWSEMWEEFGFSGEEYPYPIPDYRTEADTTPQSGVVPLSFQPISFEETAAEPSDILAWLSDHQFHGIRFTRKTAIPKDSGPDFWQVECELPCIVPPAPTPPYGSVPVQQAGPQYKHITFDEVIDWADFQSQLARFYERERRWASFVDDARLTEDRFWATLDAELPKPKGRDFR